MFLRVDSGKRPAAFGRGLRANENDSEKMLYGILVQRDERNVMVQKKLPF